jgi:hypothetical protein
MTSSLQAPEAPDPLFSSLIESGQLSLDAFARAWLYEPRKEQPGTER